MKSMHSVRFDRTEGGEESHPKQNEFISSVLMLLQYPSVVTVSSRFTRDINIEVVCVRSYNYNMRVSSGLNSQFFSRQNSFVASNHNNGQITYNNNALQQTNNNHLYKYIYPNNDMRILHHVIGKYTYVTNQSTLS